MSLGLPSSGPDIGHDLSGPSAAGQEECDPSQLGDRSAADRPDRPDCQHGLEKRRLVVVTGLSGAGKASTLHALEDIGFDAVDNPPLAMLRGLIDRAAGDGGGAVAIGIDARTPGFDQHALKELLAGMRRGGRVRAELLFLCADDAVLQRRFSETRRRHPLAEAGRIQDGIEAERALTGELREVADWVVDTSDLPLSELRRRIEARYAAGGGAGAVPALALGIVSFAFPAGLPRESDMVLDVRFLRNPHYVPALRDLTGLDPDVGAYIEADADFAAYFGAVRDLFLMLLPRFVTEGKKYFTVAIGCTGGRHRSVHMARRLAEALQCQGWPASVRHRELEAARASAGGRVGERAGAAQRGLALQEVR